MLKSELLRAIQQEIQRHDFSHFVENPPSVAQGGKGSWLWLPASMATRMPTQLLINQNRQTPEPRPLQNTALAWC